MLQTHLIYCFNQSNSHFVLVWSFSKEIFEADASQSPIAFSTVHAPISQSAFLASRAPFSASSASVDSSVWVLVEFTRASVAGFAILGASGAAWELILAESAFCSLYFSAGGIFPYRGIWYHVGSALSADDVFTLMRTRCGVGIKSNLYPACLSWAVCL